MRSVLQALIILPAIVVGVSVWAKPVNPFARPAVEAGASVVAKAESVSERPILRGLIFAGTDSIANLNGTLLSVGESFAGYQLERVDQESATFLLADKVVTLFIEEPSEENAE